MSLNPLIVAVAWFLPRGPVVCGPKGIGWAGVEPVPTLLTEHEFLDIVVEARGAPIALTDVCDVMRGLLPRSTDVKRTLVELLNSPPPEARP